MEIKAPTPQIPPPVWTEFKDLQEMEKYRQMLTRRHGPDKSRMIEQGAGNYLIFPNLIIIDGWRVFRTFYPSSPDYMEINGWACLPKEDTPEMRKHRLAR